MRPWAWPLVISGRNYLTALLVFGGVLITFFVGSAWVSCWRWMFCSVFISTATLTAGQRMQENTKIDNWVYKVHNQEPQASLQLTEHKRSFVVQQVASAKAEPRSSKKKEMLNSGSCYRLSRSIQPFPPAPTRSLKHRGLAAFVHATL